MANSSKSMPPIREESENPQNLLTQGEGAQDLPHQERILTLDVPSIVNQTPHEAELAKLKREAEELAKAKKKLLEKTKAMQKEAEPAKEIQRAKEEIRRLQEELCTIKAKQVLPVDHQTMESFQPSQTYHTNAKNQHHQ